MRLNTPSQKMRVGHQDVVARACDGHERGRDRRQA
jgi:hypothetical protein